MGSLRSTPATPIRVEIADFWQDGVWAGELLLNEAAKFLLGLGQA